jgi:hypothetical protein
LDCGEKTFEGESPVLEIPGNGVKFGRDKIADSFGIFLGADIDSEERLFLSDGYDTSAQQAARKYSN